MKKLFTAMMVVVFTLSVVGVAVAAGKEGTYQGRVEAVNLTAKTVIVKSSSKSVVSPAPATEGFIFRTDDMTKVAACNTGKTGNGLGDIKVGDEVTVTYHVKYQEKAKANRFMADRIDVRC
jgi:hypothetical protein